MEKEWVYELVHLRAGTGKEFWELHRRAKIFKTNLLEKVLFPRRIDPEFHEVCHNVQCVGGEIRKAFFCEVTFGGRPYSFPTREEAIEAKQRAQDDENLQKTKVIERVTLD